jgi:hypothetical protein
MRWIDQIKEEISHSAHPDTLSWFYEAFFVKIFAAQFPPHYQSSKVVCKWSNERLEPLRRLGAFAAAPWPGAPPAPAPPTRADELRAFVQECFANYVRAYLGRAIGHCRALLDQWGSRRQELAAVQAALAAPGRRLAYAPSVPERVRGALQWLNTVDRILQLLYPTSGVRHFGKRVADLDAIATGDGTKPTRCADFDFGIDAIGTDILLVGEVFVRECPALSLPPVSDEEADELTAVLADPAAETSYGKPLPGFWDSVWNELAAVYFGLLALWVNEVLKVEARLPTVAMLGKIARAFQPTADQPIATPSVRKTAIDCEAVRVVSDALKGFIEVVREFNDMLVYYAPQNGDESDPLMKLRNLIDQTDTPINENFTFEGLSGFQPPDDTAALIWHVVDSYTGTLPDTSGAAQ